jgi:pSer/pThr/pTyr-binding forkhead associated (FHA) protein
MAGLRHLTDTGERLFPLSGIFMIGRDPGNDLVINEQQVSRWHATIAEAHGVYVITDKGSRHGTYIQRGGVSEPQRVTESEVLRGKDIIRIGQAKLVFDEKIHFEFGAAAGRIAPSGQSANETEAFPRTEPGRVVPVMFGAASPSPARAGLSSGDGSVEFQAILDRIADLEARVSTLEAHRAAQAASE